MRSFIFTLILFASGFVQAQMFDFACNAEPAVTVADGGIFSLALEGGTTYTVYVDEGDFEGTIFIDGINTPHEEGMFDTAGLSGVLEIITIEVPYSQTFELDTATGNIVLTDSATDASLTSITFVPRTDSSSSKSFSTAKTRTTSPVVSGIASPTYFELVDEGGSYIVYTDGEVADLEVTVNGSSVRIDSEGGLTLGLGYNIVTIADGSERALFHFDVLEEVEETLAGQLGILSTKGVTRSIDGDVTQYFIDGNTEASLRSTIINDNYTFTLVTSAAGHDRLVQAFLDAFGEVVQAGRLIININEEAFIHALVEVNEVL